MPKRKAPDNTYWRGDVLWSRFRVAGREFRQSLHTGDVATAKRRVQKLIDDATAALRFGEARHTFDHVATLWADHIAREVSATTAKRYSVSVMQCLPWLTGKPIASIGRDEINAMVTARLNSTGKRPPGNATVRRDLTALASIFDFSEDQGWSQGNPARDKARKLRERRDPIVLPTEASISLILARANHTWSCLIRAARYAGCRQDELRTLRRRDLNAATKTLYIAKAKGNKARAIDLTDDAIAALSGMPASTSTETIFHLNGAPMVFVSERFKSMVAWAHRAAQKAGADFTPFRFHDLRHLYAVEYLQSGGTIYDLQKQLGHSSIATTEGYLAFLTPEEAKIAKGKSQKSA